MQRTFFLNVASHTGVLAVVSETEVLAQTAVDHRIGDAELLPLMEQTLSQAGCTYADLSRIACVTGPGGFTSLRVGVTCANVLADQLCIPLAGMHLSDVYCERTTLRQAQGDKIQEPNSKNQNGTNNGLGTLDLGSWNFLWLHSTKKTQLFVRGFGTFASTWPEPVLVNIDELLPQLPAGTPWTGELIPEHQGIMEKAGLLALSSVEGACPEPVEGLLAVLPALLNQQTYANQPLEPWYGRGW